MEEFRKVTKLVEFDWNHPLLKWDNPLSFEKTLDLMDIFKAKAEQQGTPHEEIQEVLLACANQKFSSEGYERVIKIIEANTYSEKGM